MTPMDVKRETIVIGGGIVGMATAMTIARRHPKFAPVVVEKEPGLARHQTGHNSGVIHSGLYYKPGSLKAKFCVAAARRMVEFCREHGVAHDVCGKVVVATQTEELPRLEELHRRGQANGVPGVEMIGPERLREIEPHAAGLQALFVPSTGIVDFPGATQRYAELLKEGGGEVLTGAEVLRIVRDGAGWVLETRAGTVRGSCLITCAGLHADRVAAMAGARPRARIVPFRGEYFSLVPQRQSLVRNLIYPVPDPAFPFLGVHFTRMIRGGVEAGPNAVPGLTRESYRKTDFNARDAWEAFLFAGFRKFARRHWRVGLDEIHRSFSKRAFVRGLQRLLPEIRAEDLEPGGCGVRAMAMEPDGTLVDDFLFHDDERAIHVLNAPSPAATASLLIGEAIAERAAERFGW